MHCRKKEKENLYLHCLEYISSFLQCMDWSLKRNDFMATSQVQHVIKTKATLYLNQGCPYSKSCQLAAWIVGIDIKINDVCLPDVIITLSIWRHFLPNWGHAGDDWHFSVVYATGQNKIQGSLLARSKMQFYTFSWRYFFFKNQIWKHQLIINFYPLLLSKWKHTSHYTLTSASAPPGIIVFHTVLKKALSRPTEVKD